MAIDLLPNDCSNPVAALAFDYGTQRIGVAFGQSISASAKSVTVLKAKDGIPDWDQIEKLLEEWKPDCCVVGLPYNLDGSESELLMRAVKFANRIDGRFNIRCYGMDERLSSKAAIEQVKADAGSKTQTAIDDIAAQIILENWFTEYNTQV
ncbi:MAG: Holliday junction resolvase RuvX [Gammaproteobacteria bacterium]|nr:Holliday junction resolvase RuvX [Gammaproteobacteria bacterium]